MAKNTARATTEVCVGVYIPREQHAKLKEVAAKRKQETGVNYTLSTIVRLAINEYLAKESK